MRCAFLCVFVLSGPLVSAQIPDEFTNLKVLPEDISKQDLMGYMRSWSMDLGGRCAHCHAGTSEKLNDLDFASDEKKTKKIARSMFKMLEEINAQFFEPHQKQIGCYTCHDGTNDPRKLEDRLMAVYEERGIEGLEAEYREVRQKYYGKGGYNFGPWAALGAAADRLTAKEAYADAKRAHEINLVFHPDHDYSHFVIGCYHMYVGPELEKARAAYRAAMKANASWTPKRLIHFAGKMHERGMPERGVAVLRILTELAPQLPDGYFSLGRALNEQGDKAGAEKALRKALELKPDHAAASDALSKLNSEDD